MKNSVKAANRCNDFAQEHPLKLKKFKKDLYVFWKWLGIL